MAHLNEFLVLPSPVGNGIGASVDVSGLGLKSIVVGGEFEATVTIEGGIQGAFFPIARIDKTANFKNISAPLDSLRVVVSGYVSGSPVVYMGASSVPMRSGLLSVPVGNGEGAPLDTSAYGESKNFAVNGIFDATVTLMGSEDGAEYAPLARFQQPNNDCDFMFVSKFLKVVVTDWVSGSPVASIAASETGVDSELILDWSFQTNSAVQYAGGFYDFAAASNNFSPAINYGIVSMARAAHLSIILGAVTTDVVTIEVTGDSITDEGVQTVGDSESIVIPLGTVIDSYFETSKKWNGQVRIETVSGTPAVCNYGFSKYHDVGNRSFHIHGLECIWESDSNDNTSDISLIHHKATGWTFNVGAEPGFPAPAAQRSVDYAGNNAHVASEQGSWKRTELELAVAGDDSEGFMFRVDSGNLGVGTLSFRIMTLEIFVQRVS